MTQVVGGLFGSKLQLPQKLGKTRDPPHAGLMIIWARRGEMNQKIAKNDY